MFQSIGSDTEATTYPLLLLDGTNVVQTATLPANTPEGTQISYTFPNLNPNTQYTVIINADTGTSTHELARVPITTDSELITVHVVYT